MAVAVAGERERVNDRESSVLRTLREIVRLDRTLLGYHNG